MKTLRYSLIAGLSLGLMACGGGGGGGGASNASADASTNTPDTEQNTSLSKTLLAEDAFNLLSTELDDGVATIWLEKDGNQFNVVGRTYSESSGWGTPENIDLLVNPQHLKLVSAGGEAYLTWYEPTLKNYKLSRTINGIWQESIFFPAETASLGRCYDTRSSSGSLDVVYCTDTGQIALITFDSDSAFTGVDVLDTISNEEQGDDLFQGALYPRFHEGNGQDGITWTQTIADAGGSIYSLRTADFIGTNLSEPEIIVLIDNPSALSERFNNAVVATVRSGVDHQLAVYEKGLAWSEVKVLSNDYQFDLDVQWIANGSTYLAWRSKSQNDSVLTSLESDWSNIQLLDSSHLYLEEFASGILWATTINHNQLKISYQENNSEESSASVGGTFIADPSIHVLDAEAVIIWNDNSNIYTATVLEQTL